MRKFVYTNVTLIHYVLGKKREIMSHFFECTLAYHPPISEIENLLGHSGLVGYIKFILKPAPSSQSVLNKRDLSWNTQNFFRHHYSLKFASKYSAPPSVTLMFLKPLKAANE